MATTVTTITTRQSANSNSSSNFDTKLSFKDFQTTYKRLLWWYEHCFGTKTRQYSASHCLYTNSIRLFRVDLFVCDLTNTNTHFVVLLIFLVSPHTSFGRALCACGRACVRVHDANGQATQRQGQRTANDNTKRCKTHITTMILYNIIIAKLFMRLSSNLPFHFICVLLLCMDARARVSYWWRWRAAAAAADFIAHYSFRWVHFWPMSRDGFLDWSQKRALK